MSANVWEQYDEQYETTEPIVGGMVPDGEYEVTVTHCAAGESKNKKTPQVQWGFTVASGPCAGRKISKDQNITPQGMGFVSGDFKKVFPKEWKFSQCMNSLGSLVGARLKVKVYTKKGNEFADVYINERLDTGSVQYAEPSAPAPAAQPSMPGMPAPAATASPF